MNDLNSNFGLLIAYALPGFVAIWGLSGIWPSFIECAMGAEMCLATPSLVGFLNSTVAAIAAGMAVSAIRFVVIDTLHEWSGLKRPKWNGVTLQKNLDAVRILIDHHYRYYQFHSNMIIAGVITYAAHLYNARIIAGWPELLLVTLAIVFWIASRDNLRKYYQNLEAIFQTDTERMNPMSNGMNHEHHEPKVDQQKKAKVITKSNSDQKQDQSRNESKAAASKTVTTS